MTLADAWWTQQQSGMMGAVLGGGLGSLGGLIGAGIGVLGSRGRGKRVLVPLHLGLCALGLALLAAGLLAAGMGQPHHVLFPLMLGGGVLTCVMCPLLPMTFMAYRMADARRADTGTTAPAMGPTALSPSVIGALIDMWGTNGAYRLWGRRMTMAAVPLGIIGIVWAAVAAAQGSGRESWLPAMIVGGAFVMLAAMGAGMTWMMRVQVGRLEAHREQQRLAAAEFRRT